MKVSRRYATKARIELIPLIDVIFLLLVAFIFFTMSMTISKSMPVRLPDSSTASVDRANYASVAIRQDGSLYLEGKPVTLEGLFEGLTEIHEKNPAQGVLISGDTRASYERVMAVMDQVRRAGLPGLSLETE